MSADSDEAVLTTWAIASGAEIHEGDAVAEVETDKAVVDIEAEQEATVHTLLVPDGSTVAVGDPIAILLAPGEDDSAALDLLAQLGRGPEESPAEATSGASSDHSDAALTDLDVPADAIPPETDAEGEAPRTLPTTTGRAPGDDDEAHDDDLPASKMTPDNGKRIFISPIARRIAQEHDLAIDTLVGSGPRGRITRKDVEHALETTRQTAAEIPSGEPSAEQAGEVTSAPVPEQTPERSDDAPYTEIPHTRLRRVIAERLQSSKQQAPHFYLRATVRVDDLVELRAKLNETSSIRVSLNDFFIKAVAKALFDVPEMNVVWTNDSVRQYSRVDVAVAIASERGLVTPVVRGADTLPLTRVAETVREFAARANQGRLQQHELTGGTFTVTNLGMFGVEEFSAIINPPHAGILAVGAAVRSPVVGRGGDLQVGTVITMTVSVDHRAADGALAAQWLKRLCELIENPLQILV